MVTIETKATTYTPEEMLHKALESSLEGCDYPWEVQEEFTRVINEWVESFEIKSCLTTFTFYQAYPSELPRAVHVAEFKGVALR